jgi:hypothetical protein
MKQCKDVKNDEYECGYGVCVPWSDHIATIDKCLIMEIISLWECGIKTYGCCCGHNQKGIPPYIDIEPDHLEEAQAIGYELVFPEGEGDKYRHGKTAVRPKSKVGNNIGNSYKQIWKQEKEQNINNPRASN